MSSSKSKLNFHYFHKAALNAKFCEFLRETRSHSKVVECLFSSKRITRTEQENWYIHIYKPDRLYKIFIATTKNNSEPVGYVNFIIDSPQNRRCEVGYKVHPNHWGQGYGAEMIKWSIEECQKFEDFEIQRLWLTVFSNNDAAKKIYREAGFKREATMNNYVYKDSRKRSVDLMAITF